MSIGVSEVLSLGLCLGDVAAGCVFSVAVDLAADEVDGVSAEGVLWVTGEGGFEFFDLVGILSLGSGAFCGSSPFFLLHRVTCIYSLLVSQSGVALMVSVVLVMSLVLVVSVVLVLLVVSASLYQVSCFLRADFSEMANLLTIPAARPSALYYNYHLRSRKHKVSGMAWKHSLSKHSRNV